MNTDLLPLEVSNSPWLYEINNDSVKSIDSGKWMLFYENSLMNGAWNIAKKIYRENNLYGVNSMKCSTAYKNPRSSTLEEGVIILYCNNSSNEEIIMNIGKKILEMFDYKERQIIYYKTNLQTREGTFATGIKKNHIYKLYNHLYMGKCLIKLPEEEPLIIERQYPSKLQEKSYPKRHDNSTFEKLNEMNTNIELQNDYKKWKDGINYKSNRKIKIGGKIHIELMRKFMIYSCGGILFDTLNHINANEYLQETEKINNDIDVKNTIIKDYNKSIDSIIEKIQKLERWNDFIEFEGKKYGLTDKVKNNVHIENDCFGEMIFTCKETTYTFNDRPFCNYDDIEETHSIYKCSKCEYVKKILECKTGGGSQYISRYGFWWK